MVNKATIGELATIKLDKIDGDVISFIRKQLKLVLTYRSRENDNATQIYVV